MKFETEYGWTKMGYAISNKDKKCAECGREFKAEQFTSFACQGGDKCALKNAVDFQG